MKRLASAVSFALLLSAASCGSSSTTPKVDTGVTADTGTSTDTAASDTAASDTAAGDTAAGDVASDTGPGMCLGTFASVTRAQLGAATMATGKCAASTDLDLVCNGVPSATGPKTINDIAAACGVMCATMTPPMGEACITPCVKSKAALTDACVGCYSQAVLCAEMNCIAECLADPKGAACTACQVSHGCISAFFACSGLPAPPSGDGGVSDASAGDGGVVDMAAATDAVATDTAAAADTAAASDASTD